MRRLQIVFGIVFVAVLVLWSCASTVIGCGSTSVETRWYVTDEAGRPLRDVELHIRYDEMYGGDQQAAVHLLDGAPYASLLFPAGSGSTSGLFSRSSSASFPLTVCDVHKDGYQRKRVAIPSRYFREASLLGVTYTKDERVIEMRVQMHPLNAAPAPQQ